jgi:hypothetical protein
MWRGLHLFGVFALICIGYLLYLTWQLFQAHLSHRFLFIPRWFIQPLILAAIVLVPIGVKWGRYRRPPSTPPCSEVITPLVASAKEFRLIRRAHSIVLILPPTQEIRESFRWEIDQLTRQRLQSRVTIVLPPDRRYQHDFPKCFQYACIVAAALEGFAGSIDDVDSMKVHNLEMSIHARAHVLKYARPTVYQRGTLIWWIPMQRRLGRRRGPYAGFYYKALTAAFQSTERELSGLGFRAATRNQRRRGSAQGRWSRADCRGGSLLQSVLTGGAGGRRG